MALITVALAFLGVWSISAQVLHKSIVPKEVKLGSEVTVFCDSDLAGVPENGSPEGIFALELCWNKQFFYEFSTKFGTNRTIGVNTHWRTNVSGHYPKNSFGLFDRDKVRLEIDMINITLDDQGEFCCSSYIIQNGEIQRPSERCEDFIVTNHSIVEPSDFLEELTFKWIHCTPNLAGIPDTATEVENLTMFWQNKDFDPNSYFLYTLRSYWNSYKQPSVFLIKPRIKDRWAVSRYYKDVKPNKRMDKDKVRLLLAIWELNTEDVGWYCCSVTYFDKLTDAKHLTSRCHYLSASGIKAMLYTKNGSSLKIVTESQIFGLLIFSWTLLQFYRGE
ncbi:uncharacterized protein LOC131937881 [Physella acuta]|uniref:uncharacterized protein LOC131937881 n=1 Tax=Physella acuta TaxID=109671 RepID=UPI0027DE883C|nr:uncharacterized protein LOC131937881 [Physella acuta]